MVGPSDCKPLQRNRIPDASGMHMGSPECFLHPEEVAGEDGETWRGMVKGCGLILFPLMPSGKLFIFDFNQNS